MSGPVLSVVIPVLNEEQRLPPTMERILRYLDARGDGPHELVVVDDGSSDRSSEVVRSFQRAEGTAVVLVRAEHNRGKGAAVRDGMLAARGRRRVMCDADLSTPIEEVEALERRLDNGAEIAIGSRGLADCRVEVHQPWLREHLGKLFNHFVRAVTGLPIRDTQCGFKLFADRSVPALFEPLVTPGFAFDVEVLMRAHRLGMRIDEIPVVWRNDPRTKVRPAIDGTRMVLDVVRIRARLALEGCPGRGA
ncbi:MAG: dolichyl-phosphate beta-glucosyltransferase [bacterium]